MAKITLSMLGEAQDPVLLCKFEVHATKSLLSTRDPHFAHILLYAGL